MCCKVSEYPGGVLVNKSVNLYCDLVHISKVMSCQVIYSQFGLAIHQNDHQARRRFVEWAQNEIAVVPDFHKHQEFRNTRFDNSVAQARLFVEKSTFEIESQFKEKRTARKKQMFGYEHIDEPIQSFEMQYRVTFFNTMIDAIIVDTECRFKALNEYYEQFGFI
ncbi:zinc finger MYM-type protein 1 [Trichonephila clavipes]|nr:zinc finger MYM-type protein 1 [Trichonephila clavipes]